MLLFSIVDEEKTFPDLKVRRWVFFLRLCRKIDDESCVSLFELHE